MTDNIQISAPPSPAPNVAPGQNLDDLIKQLKEHGVTLELIIMMIMSNPDGTGAMDHASNSIAGITNESNLNNDVQTDIININAVLSKLEQGQNSKSLIQQLQDSYKKLFGAGGDLDKLAAEAKDHPDVNPTVSTLKNWQNSFKAFKLSWNHDSTNVTSFNTDIMNWNGDTSANNPVMTDIGYMMQQHKPGSPGDFLQNWWTEGNAGQQLTSGQSQKATTEVQSLMQLLQGFDSSAQQDIQLAGTQKTQMINNEKQA